jgi:hypothetical protein
MLQRGRKSADKLVAEKYLNDQPRPEAPDWLELTKKEKDVWRRTLAVVPPNWVKEQAYPMLAQYCRLVIRSSYFTEMIDKAKKNKDAKEMGYLVRQATIQTRQMSMLSNKLALDGPRHSQLLRKYELRREQADLLMPSSKPTWTEHEREELLDEVNNTIAKDEHHPPERIRPDKSRSPWDEK